MAYHRLPWKARVGVLPLNPPPTWIRAYLLDWFCENETLATRGLNFFQRNFNLNYFSGRNQCKPTSQFRACLTRGMKPILGWLEISFIKKTFNTYLVTFLKRIVFWLYLFSISKGFLPFTPSHTFMPPSHITNINNVCMIRLQLQQLLCLHINFTKKV